MGHAVSLVRFNVIQPSRVKDDADVRSVTSSFSGTNIRGGGIPFLCRTSFHVHDGHFTC
jgi:hypothetical protein